MKSNSPCLISTTSLRPINHGDAEKAAETSIAEVEADPVDAANNEPSTADGAT